MLIKLKKKYKDITPAYTEGKCGMSPCNCIRRPQCLMQF